MIGTGDACTSYMGADDNLPPAKWNDAGEVAVVQQGTESERQASRVEVRLVVSVETESNFYTGFTENLSQGGVFVATHAQKSIGSSIDLVISLPDQPIIRAKGTVRWLRPYSETNDAVPGMGVRFEQLTEEDARRIHDFARGRQPMFFDDDDL